jgi:feruloyl esterase
MLAPILNANNPDLLPLKKRNGKIIMYTGTCDPIVPFQDAVNYYERVVEKVGSLEETQDFFRYFIIPGMNHCGGGPGVNDFGQSFPTPPNPDREQDVLTLLMDWVERHEAPERMIATRYKDGTVEMQRPVYPYPDFPRYKGGDPAKSRNYERVTHPRGNVPVPAGKYLK